MKLETTDLCQLSEYAIIAATQAGELIARQVASKLVIETKQGGESLASQVVTEVDLMAQELIISVLSPTFDRYNLALLAEESADDNSRLKKDYFWCIDPLDGTLPFTEGIPGYAVSIALVSKNGEPQIGVVYDPVKGNHYHAVKGGGAFKNQQPWPQETHAPDAPLHFICDRSITANPLFDQIISDLKKMSPNGLKTRLTGGAVMNAIWVLENGPACYFKLPKQTKGGGSVWDYAATACIYQELGLPATDIHGKPLQLNQPDTTFMNNKGILYTSSTFLAEKIHKTILVKI